MYTILFNVGFPDFYFSLGQFSSTNFSPNLIQVLEPPWKKKAEGHTDDLFGHVVYV